MKRRTLKWVNIALYIAILALLFTGIEATAQSTASAKAPIHFVIGSSEVQLDTPTDKYWPNDAAKEIFRQTGITFDIQGMDNDKFKVLIAGGNLPEIILTWSPLFNKQLLESGQLLPLDSLLKTNGPDILKYSPERVPLSKKFDSDSSGQLYFIAGSGGQYPPPFKAWAGYKVRWQYYKELGYPAIKDELQFLDVLKAMQKKHPLTAEGKKVYGVGYSNEYQDGLWHYTCEGLRTGYFYYNTNECVISLKDNVMIPNFYGDDNAPWWVTMKFLYKANQMGLLDPDSFTMKTPEYQVKMTAGQYLSDISDIFTSGYDSTALQKDPNTLDNFENIPVVGSSVGWDNQDVIISSYRLAITKNCKNPERAMDLINAFSNPDLVRVALSGVKGVNWDIINGKAQLLPDTLKNLNNQEFIKKAGIGYFIVLTLRGGEKHPDGQYMDLKASEQVFTQRLSPADKDFCNYYKVKYPMQAIDNLLRAGKMTDASTCKTTNFINLMPTPPDDIQRMQTKIVDIVLKGIPRMALAKNDADFDAIKKDVRAQLKAAGAEKSVNWWLTEYKKIMDQVKQSMQ